MMLAPWSSNFTLLLGISCVWSTSFLQSVAAQNFEFATSKPTHCDSMTIAWKGGKPPIVAKISAPGGSQRNMTLQSNDTGPQSFGVFVPLPKDKTLLVTLSDATGFASGGTSQLLTVGDTVSGNNCNTTDPGVDFVFNLDSPLVQCRPFPITGFVGAVQPVTISILVPGGQSTVITAPISSTNSFNWTANVKAGTSVVFSMTDANGRNGGTEEVRVVGSSVDSSCLNNPISSPPAAMIPFPPAKRSQRPPPRKKSKGGLSVGAIVGIVVGVVGLLVGVGHLILRCMRRKSNSYGLVRPGKAARVIDLEDTYSPTNLPPGQYTPDPFVHPHTSSAVPNQHDRKTRAHPPGHMPSAGQPSSSGADTSSNTDPDSGNAGGTSSASVLTSRPLATSTSASESSAPQGSRIVVHTDIAEGEDVVELPPQYSENRPPLPEKLTTSIGLPGGP